MFSVAAADAIDDYVLREMQAQKIPGLSLAIVQNGEIAKLKGYGLANVEHGVPASADTIFQSGSVGKQFTAAGILLLADRGDLDLDDPLAMYFPDSPAAWHAITLRHLLTHTSGLKDYAEEIDYRRDYSEAEILKIMQGLPQEFEPGTQWSYSNSGYTVLGLLTSRLAGEHWSDFLKREVFAAAGMTSTQVITESAIVPHRAAGYERADDGELRNQEWVAPSLNRMADGALYFSARDLAAWDQALRKRLLLSGESYSAWWMPVTLAGNLSYPYGFGWDVTDQRGRRLVEHGGSWQGFRTFIARYLDDNITIAVLANVADAQPGLIAHEIAGMLRSELALPAVTAAGKNADDTRTAILRGVLEAWATWRTTDAMHAALAGTRTGSAREAYNRDRVADQLRRATDFVWLADDEVADRGMQRRSGEVVRIAYFALEAPEDTYRYRFYLTTNGQVLDFDEI